MTTPSGYQGSGQDPYGSAGQYPSGPVSPGSYPPPGQFPAGPSQYGQYPAGQYPAQAPYPGGQAPYPGGPAPYGPAGHGRPGLTTAAAVLAFIFGAGAIIQSFFGIVIGSLFSSAGDAGGLVSSSVNLICNSDLPSYSAADCAEARANAGIVSDAAGSIGTFGIILGIGAAIVAVLLIWGGVVLLSGKNAQMVVIACGVYFLLTIALMVATSFGFFYIFGLVLPVLIVVFTLSNATKTWVRSKGGKTF